MPKIKDHLSEYEHQKLIFDWAKVMSLKYPVLKLLNGSLNGVRLTITQAVKAKKNGMKKGYPDIFLPVACGGYHGLFIELKNMDGKLTPEQLTWIKDLQEQGYYAVCCKGYDNTKKLIIDYLEGNIKLEMI